MSRLPRVTLPRQAAELVMRWGVKPVLSPHVPPRLQRIALDAGAFAMRLPHATDVTRTLLAGRPALRVAGPDPDEARGTLLVHGGAFITGSLATHKGFAAGLAHASGAPVWLLDHRLAPEHPHPAGVDDVVAALQELQRHRPTSLVGDSAGGALALLAVLRLRDEGSPLPERVALASPLVDLTRASSRAWTGRDSVVSPGWAEQGTAAYVGDHDPRALSPLFADLTGLPPLLVHVSEHESLRPEGEALAAAARSAGVEVELALLDDLWHDPHVQAGLVAEAAAAVEAMGRWLAGAPVG